MIAIVRTSAASGLRCSLTRLVAISSPNNIGSSKSNKRKVKNESKGKTFMRGHGAAAGPAIDQPIGAIPVGDVAPRRIGLGDGRSGGGSNCLQGKN
jgi:hypothetical protein